ncbi:gamma-glutamyl-gamma-aminobutyrate hydrolase family protein [Verrucomicrobia bacterium LW23]|nr:gamma-glutamyl-gamma-aminobutyrate hydrolase family protein [Verrucomicrobia bacterium LW23]
MRESDDRYFTPWAQLVPGLELRNARTSEVDMAEADALLLTGGCDISELFLRPRQPVPDPSLIQDPQMDRDAWEFPAVMAAFERNLPILAICRGVQVLNVALGGTLILDIPGHTGPRDENAQPLRWKAGAAHSFPRVNSSHHQALDRLAWGLEVEAWSATDDIIEQVRHTGQRFVLGTQYHPERDRIYYAPIFSEFARHVQRPAGA